MNDSLLYLFIIKTIYCKLYSQSTLKPLSVARVSINFSSFEGLFNTCKVYIQVPMNHALAGVHTYPDHLLA